MIVECKNCGAPLDVQVGSAFARCSYCGHSNKVKSAKTLMAESPANWQPPPVWQPPPQFRAPHVPLPYQPRPAPRRRGSGCLGLVLGLGLPIGIGGFLLYVTGALTSVPFVGVQLDAPPTIATIDAATLPFTQPAANADGSYSASTLSSVCRGYIARQPQFLLRVTEPTPLRIAARDGAIDLVMAIRTSDGRWLCDDDGGGSRMPLVSALLPAGDHRVWVGPYSQGESSPFTFSVERSADVAPGTTPPVVGAPPPRLVTDAAPLIGEVELADGPLDGRWPGIASAGSDASAYSTACRGTIATAPHLRIRSTTPRRVELVTRDNGGIDLVMLVLSPSGRIECDDDSGGSLNPRIRTMLEPGVTHVWIGVYHREQVARFQLELDARDAPIDLGGPPTLGTINLDAPGHPTQFTGTARGARRLAQIGADCQGFVGRASELVLITTAPRQLGMRLIGPGLRLVRRDPTGAVTCTEADGDLSTIEAFAAGTHHVWVGTARRGDVAFALSLSP